MKTYGKVVVLAGGISSERDISLKSGEAVHEALKRKGLDVELLDIKDDFEDTLPRLLADEVFIALHGRFGEDGTIQGILEEAGLPYTGSGVHASKLALDKIASREIFQANGINVPEYKTVRQDEEFEKTLLDLRFPCVVKPRSEGSSIGLSIVKEETGLRDALSSAFGYDETVIIEDYIDGKELTVGILEDTALPIIEIASKDNVYDYSAKYTDKDTIYTIPRGLSRSLYKDIQGVALKSHIALCCRDFSRVDMRLDKRGRIYVLEVNTIPGMTERSLLPKAAKEAGVGFDDLCIRLVELAYRRRVTDGEKKFEKKQK